MGERISEISSEEIVTGIAGQKFGKDNFRMYYALGPEVDQVNSIDYNEESKNEDFEPRKYKYFVSDLWEDSEYIDQNVYEEKQVYNKTKICEVKDDELSDDSGTVDDHEWKGSSIPPDVVASANCFKVIREEPRTNTSTLDCDMRKSEELFRSPCEQDITDFRRHQVEAYKNLDDLLDEPWEESDFAPPSKVDIVLRVGGELGERYTNGAQGRRKVQVLQKSGLSQDLYQCGPHCNSCSIM